MRSSTVLLAFTASVIGLPYQKDEGLFDVQSPPEEFLASNDLQDLYSDDKIADNPTDEISQNVSQQQYSATQCPKASNCDQQLQITIKAVSKYLSYVPKQLLPDPSLSCHSMMQSYFAIIPYISPWAPRLQDCDHDNDPKWLMEYWGCQSNFHNENACRSFSDMSSGCRWSPAKDPPPLECTPVTSV